MRSLLGKLATEYGVLLRPISLRWELRQYAFVILVQNNCVMRNNPAPESQGTVN